MTLIELLVVIAILGLLAATVLPSFSASSDRRQTREAVRSASSFISQAQSRAIGRTEWAGFWLLPASEESSAALDLCFADVPEVFRGDTVGATVTGAPGASPFFNLDPATGTLGGASVQGKPGDLVRLGGNSLWFVYVDAWTIRMNPDAVTQSPSATAWPAPGIKHTFEILRQPVRSGSPMNLVGNRCIDLRWSGLGGNSLSTYRAFGSSPTASPGSIAVLFDGAGRLRQLFAQGTRTTISETLYLLVGRSDRAGQDAAAISSADDTIGANWQYRDCFWMSVDPTSGVVKTAECKTGASDVFDSQFFIRSQMTTGGR